MKKKVISLILVLAMFLPMLEPICLAVEESDIQEEKNVSEEQQIEPEVTVELKENVNFAFGASNEGDFKYTVNNNEVTITGYSGNDTEIIIPNIINGYSVTSIRYYAFFDYSNLTSITIPDSVTSIGNDAFSGCSSLKEIKVDSDNSNYSSENGVLYDKDKTKIIKYPPEKEDTAYTIPDSVTSIEDSAFSGCSKLSSITISNSVTFIGNYAFSGCSKLSSVTISNSVTIIGSSAFSYCSSLTSITIPDSVRSIDGGVFSGCSSLANINVDATNQYYSSEDGVLYDKNKTKIIKYPYKREDTNYVIPNSVTSIDRNIFEKGTNLTSITIPDSVRSIDRWAFSECSSLANINVDVTNQYYSSEDGVLYDKNKTKIIKYPYKREDTNYVIPNSVTSIDKNVFEWSTNLTSITIPKSITSISGWAFAGCSNLTDVIILEGVTNIHSRAFEDCNNLKNITIPQSVTSIEAWAFANCTNLTNIILPDNLISIAESAFWNCSSLTDITIPDSVTNIEKCAFYNCSGLTDITFPQGLTKIGAQLFEGCSNLTSITIPDGVKEIPTGTFANCTNLKSITIPNNVTKIDETAFFYTGNGDLTIYCYSNSVARAFADLYHIRCGILDEEVIQDYDNTFKYQINVGEITIIECYKKDEKIVIPEKIENYSVTSIAEKAFENCNTLKNLTVPNTVTNIGDKTFKNCKDLTIYGYENSYAQEYAENHKIKFELIKTEEPTKTYTVTFKDYDGKVLKTESVEEGKSATAPNAPARQGYTFTKWDKEFGNITSDLTVTAQYKKNETKPDVPVTLDKPSKDETIPNIDITPYMFNAIYYADMNSDLKDAFGYNETALRNHYLTYGIKEGRQATPIFNARYYLDKNADVKKAFNNSCEQAYYHFINNGAIEGRQGSKYFDITYYLNKNGDVKKTFKNNYTYAVMHFATSGIKEGRQASKEFNITDYYKKCSGYVKKKLGKDYIKYYAHSQGATVIVDNPIDITPYMFDVNLYYNLYKDLQQVIGYDETALKQHYLTCGIKEGRIASYIFDPAYYLNNYGDLKKAFGNNGYERAYNHFINNGIHEGRQANKLFSASEYLKNYSDLSNEFGTNYSKALQHFVNYGMNEGRQASKAFNVTTYKKKNKDLSNAFGSNWKQYFWHYILWGQNEKRNCV